MHTYNKCENTERCKKEILGGGGKITNEKCSSIHAELGPGGRTTPGTNFKPKSSLIAYE